MKLFFLVRVLVTVFVFSVISNISNADSRVGGIMDHLVTGKIKNKGTINMKHLKQFIAVDIEGVTNNSLSINAYIPPPLATLNSHTSVVPYNMKRTHMHPLQIFGNIVDEIRTHYCMSTNFSSEIKLQENLDSVSYSKLKIMEYFEDWRNMEPDSNVCRTLIEEKLRKKQEFLDSMENMKHMEKFQQNIMYVFKDWFFHGLTSAYANMLLMSVYHLESTEHMWQQMGKYCRVQLNIHGFHWVSNNQRKLSGGEFSYDQSLPPDVYPPDETELQEHVEEEVGKKHKKFFSTMFSIQKRSVHRDKRNSGLKYEVDSFVKSSLQLGQSMVISQLKHLYHKMSLISVEGSMLQLGFLASFLVSNHSPFLALLYGASLLFARLNYEILTELVLEPHKLSSVREVISSM